MVGLLDTISLAASIASLVLSVLAIWLAIVFYRMTRGMAERSDGDARAIAASVMKLEKLFDRLYGDAFSMVKDTVLDMRRHIWPAVEDGSSARTETQEQADVKAKALKEDFYAQIRSVLQQPSSNEAKLIELGPAVDKVITESREVDAEARAARLGEWLARQILDYGPVRAWNIVARAQQELGSTGAQTLAQLIAMRANGQVAWEGGALTADTVVSTSSYVPDGLGTSSVRGDPPFRGVGQRIPESKAVRP